jgi:predicted ABC-type transport system involved in lysophospholipase L1 biosynthesis ATPase subunit
MDLLLDIRRTRGATLMLATHDTALASRADAQLRLRGGRADGVER